MDRPARGSSALSGEKLLLLIAFGLAIAYLVLLANLFAAHSWIVDAGGQPISTDFLGVWSAGRLALNGAAIAAYDGHLQRAAEVAAAGHDFVGYYPWSYPPSFLFVAAALARLPYAVAFALMVGASLSLYGVTIASIVQRPGAVLVALAAPWVLATASVGQNGFLTAAIIGAVLLTLEERPAFSGLILGLLSYKPHFGLLFPLVLAATGRWRAFGWAAASVVGLTAASILVFGQDVFSAFLTDLPRNTQSLIADGGVGWSKLQSPYSLLRALGASSTAAWTVQGVVSLASASSIVWLWRSHAPFDLKAAALTVAAMLVTPYVFAYDLPALAVAAAFLYRHRRFGRLDYAALAVSFPAMVALSRVNIPAGLFASLALAAVIARRCAGALAEAPTPYTLSGQVLPNSIKALNSN